MDWHDLTFDAEDALRKARRSETEDDRQNWLQVASEQIDKARLRTPVERRS